MSANQLASLKESLSDIDFVFIQEHYAICINSSVLANVPPGYVSFHSLSMDHAYGAAIIVKSCYVAKPRTLPLHLSNYVSCIDVTTCVGSFRLMSIYVRPTSGDISSTLRPILDVHLSPTTVCAIDSNAKNNLWNSTLTDRKGLELESILSDYRLNLANVPICDLDFIPGGTSFVDQTFAGDGVTISRWFFLSIPSLSDHPYIYFEMLANSHHPVVYTPKITKSIPHISSINKSTLINRVAVGLTKYVFPNDLTCDQLQSQIVNLSQIISASARSAKVDTAVVAGAFGRRMPWWTKPLCALRAKTRQSYKIWSKLRSAESRVVYQANKAEYQRELPNMSPLEI